MEAFDFVLTLATIAVEACLKVATKKDRIPWQEAILDSTRFGGGFYEAHVKPAIFTSADTKSTRPCCQGEADKCQG
jgi:hypothetical protein